MGRVRRRRAGRASWATPLVVLNGPRHFLMDSVSVETAGRAVLPRAADAEGRRRSRSAAPPTWSRRRTPTARSRAATPGAGSAGRTRVRARRARRRRLRDAELLADRRPEAAARASCRTLGRRLDAARGLAVPDAQARAGRSSLAASGSATIVQDELQNTYQLATTTRPPGPRRASRGAADGHDAHGPGADHAGHGRGPRHGDGHAVREGHDRARGARSRTGG